MKSQQLSILFEIPGIPVKQTTTEDHSAHDCFWKIHQYREKCDCPISWTEWEEKTGKKIWDIA